MPMLAAVCRTAARHMFSSKYLLVTNTVSYGALMGLADCAVQRVEKQMLDKEQRKFHCHDWHRTGKMLLLGIVIGPVCHGWYSLLDKYLPSTRGSVVIKKILLDQIVAAPTFLGIFFMVGGMLEKQSIEKSWVELKSKFWKVYMFDWSLWPAAQAINFVFVPARFRVIYVGALTLFWDCYLTYVKHESLRTFPLVRRMFQRSEFQPLSGVEVAWSIATSGTAVSWMMCGCQGRTSAFVLPLKGTSN